MNLRITAATAAALALAVAPAAHAKVQTAPDGVFVCNTASQNWQGGDLSVSAADPQGALRFSDDLRPMNDHGVGLYNAALHSRALAVCGDPAPVDGGGTGGGDTTGGDTGGGMNWGGSGG